MGWQYMLTCTFDFIIFPIGYSLIQALFNGTVSQQWHPITLEGAGLYHIAMGAILGVTAWSRGQENMLITQMQPPQPPYNPPTPDPEDTVGGTSGGTDGGNGGASR